jgi:hypothetical protein
LAFPNYWPQRETMTNQYFFFWKSKKSRKAMSYFLLSSSHFVFMWPQTFKFCKKYGFSQKTFLRIVRYTNIHFESFLKFDSAHFGIQIDRFKKFFFWWKKKCSTKKSKKKFSKISRFIYQNMHNQILRNY